MSRRPRCGWSQLVFISSLCVALFPYPALFAQSTSPSANFTFPVFRSTDPVITFGDVQYNPVNLSFTLNANPGMLGAKLLFSEKVRMKDSNAVASFSTSFTFSITQHEQYSPTSRSGWLSYSSGFIFTFSSYFVDKDMSNHKIFNHYNRLIFSQYNSFFAIEFDTYNNYVYDDPSDNHIGVDLKSLKSSYTYNLCGGETSNCSFPWTGRAYTAWIDYNGSTQSLEVRLSKGSMADGVTKFAGGPLIIIPTLELVDTIENYMYVGFIGGATGQYVESYEILSWDFASSFTEEFPSPSTQFSLTSLRRFSTKNDLLIFGLICTTFFSAILFAILCLQWKREPSIRKYEPSLAHLMGPRIFTLKELRKATKNFSESLILGRGGFGFVYKGTLAPSGMVVAVKRLKHESEHVEKEFLAEVSTISQIRHRNLVQLQGWSHEEGHYLLVYDYMSNGSLDEWLFPSRRRYPHDPKYTKFELLPWELCFSILAGVAAALEHLHEDWVQCVLHRDIKSSNVLLDTDFNAHLGDFGLGRLIDHEKLEKTTMMAGTLGYMAPEIVYTGKATKESDVYSFGILMLEVLSGKKPINLLVEDLGQDYFLMQSVWRAHEAGNILSVVDSKLLYQIPSVTNSTPDGMEQANSETSANKFSVVRMGGELGSSKSKVAHMLHLGLQCCLLDPGARPPMRVVKQVIMQLQDTSEMEPSATLSNLMPPLPPTMLLGSSLPTSSSEASKSSPISKKSSLEVVKNMLQWSKSGKESTE